MLDKIFSDCLATFCIGTLQFYCEFGRYLSVRYCCKLQELSADIIAVQLCSKEKLQGLIRPVMHALKLGKLDIQIVDVAENLSGNLRHKYKLAIVKIASNQPLDWLIISCDNELGFSACRSRTSLKCEERFRDLAGRRYGDMDVVGLQDPAKVGLVRCATAQSLQRRLLVSEGFKEGEGEFSRIERAFSKGRYGFFNLDRIH